MAQTDHRLTTPHDDPDAAEVRVTQRPVEGVVVLRPAQDRQRVLRDEGTDLAAALTYYAVLALFPAAIALTSVLGLVGQATALERCSRSSATSGAPRW